MAECARWAALLRPSPGHADCEQRDVGVALVHRILDPDIKPERGERALEHAGPVALELGNRTIAVPVNSRGLALRAWPHRGWTARLGWHAWDSR